jgi:hypothetical protein
MQLRAKRPHHGEPAPQSPLCPEEMICSHKHLVRISDELKLTLEEQQKNPTHL